MAGLLKYSDFENWREVDHVVEFAQKDVIKDVRRLNHVTYWGGREKLALFKVAHPKFFETNFRTLSYEDACRFYEEHNDSAVSEYLDINLMLRVTKLVYRRRQFEQLLDRVLYAVNYLQSWGYEITSISLSAISEAVFVSFDGTQFDRFRQQFEGEADFTRVPDENKFSADKSFTVRISTSGDISLPDATANLIYTSNFDVDLDVTRWIPVPQELLIYHNQEGQEIRSSSPTAAKTARQARDAKNTMLRWKLGLTQ